MLKEALLARSNPDKSVSCSLCAHRCLIKEGDFGLCGARENKGGALYTHAYEDLAAAGVDPIEKKPFFHLLPGSVSFSIAAYGCNLRCDFCQNWRISQVDYKGARRREVITLSPRQAVDEAKHSGSASISFTYTEPTIFFEYALDIAMLAKDAGILCALVTNGYMTKEMLEYSKGYFQAANVDLKSFSDKFYNKFCQAKLGPVCDSIIEMKKLGIWVEVTTLLIPGRNDSPGELKSLAGFIASAGRDIPWHISRFHPDYKVEGIPLTAADSLQSAYETGREAGLKYVYIGNAPGRGENTFCPACGELLIEREGFSVSLNKAARGRCPVCRERVEGIFA